MDESLTERRRVMDEVLRDVNIFYEGGSLLTYLMNKGLLTRASSSGNTSAPSVIRNYWA
jgi:hypothetical protein